MCISPKMKVHSKKVILLWFEKKSNYLCCLYNLHILPTMHHNTFSFYIIMTYRCVILILVATVE